MTTVFKTKIKVSIDEKKIQIRMQKGQKKLVRLVRQKSDPYVPYLSGDLKNKAKERHNRIIYDSYHGGNKSYAARNYYTNRGMGRQGLNRGGKRGRFWIKRMWTDHKNSITKEVATTIGGRIK